MLHGGDGCGCAVPQGAEGFPALLERLQRLPGFDNRAVIEAMGSASPERFPCWHGLARRGSGQIDHEGLGGRQS